MVESIPTGNRPHVCPRRRWSISIKCSPCINQRESRKTNSSRLHLVPSRRSHQLPRRRGVGLCGACEETIVYGLFDQVCRTAHQEGRRRTINLEMREVQHDRGIPAFRSPALVSEWRTLPSLDLWNSGRCLG
jgi:hypothetical protein